MGNKSLGVATSIDAVADAAAPTAYTAPTAAQGVTVTSAAATDLDDAAAALVVLVGEVTTLTTKVNEILTALREHSLMDA